MPTISDLKEGSINLEQATAENAQTGYVPEIHMGEPIQGSVQQTQVVEDGSIEKNTQSVVSMTSGGETTRTKVNPGDVLPTREEVEGIPGVDQRESIQADIFAPGGPFDQYYDEKVEEYAERMDQEEIMQSEQQRLSDRGETTEDTGTNQPMDPIGDFFDGVDVNDVSDQRTVVPISLTETKNSESEDNKEISEESSMGIENDNHDMEVVKVKNDLEDDDFDDEVEVDTSGDFDDEVLSEEEQEKNLALLKNMVTDKIRPKVKKLDLSSFTVSKKINVSNNIIDIPDAKAITWALPNTGVSVTMKEFTGQNIERMRSALEDDKRNPDIRSLLNIMYNHIVSPKPSFEKWTKTTAYNDLDHLFFSVYAASFQGANYFPVECANKDCENSVGTYLTDDIPMLDMVRYSSDEDKKYINSLIDSQRFESEGYLTTEIVAITDRIAIGFKIPSLYSIYIESNYFDSDFRKKYTSAIGLLPYIDNLYVINQDTKTLDPIGYKIYTNNPGATAKSRAKRYDKFLSILSSDDFTLIAGLVADIVTKTEKSPVRYGYPETTCPFCGTVNEASGDQSAQTMVFSRNQLGLLATT